MHPTTTRRHAGTLLAATLALGLTLASCGDDTPTAMHGTSMPMHTTAVTTATTPAGVDAAFVRQMIPHHQMAVVMARAVKDEAKHPEVRKLARDIIAAQTKEIAELKAIAKANGYDLSGAGTMMGGDASMMGMDVDDMGMSMHTGDLSRSDDLDRAFITMMIPHHEGAIVMAKVQLAKGADPRLHAMSKAIIAAQTKEINEMRRWLKAW